MSLAPERGLCGSMWEVLAYVFAALACITFVVVLAAAFDE
jgi:hypothetical protein